MKKPSLYSLARHCFQIAVIIVFCALPWFDAMEDGRWNFVRGSFFALDLAGVPFADPVAALQTVAQLVTGCVPGLRLVLGALFSLCIAFLLGRVFCSWICPYGFFSELVARLRKAVTGKSPESRGQTHRHDKIFAVKGALVAVGVVLAVALGYPALELLSMPGELSLVPILIFERGDDLTVFFVLLALAIPLAALVVEAVTGRRLWCRFVCPQSVLLGLAARLLPKKVPGLRIGWQPRKCSCRGISPCRMACPMALDPRRLDGPGRRDCIVCGDCLKTCRNHGQALEWRSSVSVRKPATKTRNTSQEQPQAETKSID